jgi:acetylornithine deacetylase/succinyl-diaminopimelate desuccinylase-like protein
VGAVDDDVGQRAVELLRQLIRFDTSNPPGQELAAQEHLKAVLEGAGFACELVGAEPARPNLVARLAGRSDGPTLCLLGHIDTVPAAPERWSLDPFGGELRDGCVWGRGAIDMKSQVAAQVAAAVALAEQGGRPEAGELLIVVTADEETGGACGARWLCREHPELVRCDMLINEGGGMALEVGARRVYGVGVGEKGVFRATIVTEGRDGHASVPGIGDNALVKLARIVHAIANHAAPVEATPEAGPLLTALGYAPHGDPGRALARLWSDHPPVAAVVEPGLRVTLSPTMIRASEKVNVIPGTAVLQVDCRAPPGLGPDDVRERIEKIVGADGYTLDWDRADPGNRSPANAPLMDHVRSVMAELDPGAAVVPRLFCAFSDSHWFRRAFPGCVAYGFFPQRAMGEAEALPLMHAVDERIAVADVELSTAFYADLVARVLR